MLTPPLAGVRVIDLTIWLQGPLAGQLLADMGADVVKVERPGRGDFARSLAQLYGAPLRTADDRFLIWELYNRNKRSIAIDLATPAGQALLHRMVAQADVFVTNFQESTLAAFDALPERLLEVNPRLVYALGGGLGVQNHLSGLPMQDTAATAYSGFMFTAATPEGEPAYPPGALGDTLAGTMLGFAALAGLQGRQQDGKGRVVSTSLLQTMMWAQLLSIGVAANTGVSMPPFNREQAPNPMMNLYRCQDGRWIALGLAGMAHKPWTALCEALGHPEWAPAPDFSSTALRAANARRMQALFEDVIPTRPAAEWIERLRAVELPCSVVNRPADLIDDAAVTEEGLVERTDRGLRFVRSPFTVRDTPLPHHDAPALGAEADAILADYGCTTAEIAALRDGGTVS